MGRRTSPVPAVPTKRLLLDPPPVAVDSPRPRPSPIRAAAEELEVNGRPDEHWGIIFLSDGAANQPENGKSGDCGSEPDSRNPCEYAVEKAEEAKALGIEVYTIGYGVDDVSPGSMCGCDRGIWEDAPARDVLTAMATDEYHYFEEPAGGDLTPVFETIGWQLVTGIRLVPVLNP